MENDLTQNLKNAVQNKLSQHGNATVQMGMDNLMERVEMMKEVCPLMTKREVALQQMAKTDDTLTLTLWVLVLEQL